jgi:hypothetical protein
MMSGKTDATSSGDIRNGENKKTNSGPNVYIVFKRETSYKTFTVGDSYKEISFDYWVVVAVCETELDAKNRIQQEPESMRDEYKYEKHPIEVFADPERYD